MAIRKRQGKALDKWVQQYEDWRSSGMSQARYCKTKGESLWTFKSKVRTLIQAGKIKRQHQKKVTEFVLPAFAPVAVVGNSELAADPYCEIRFRAGGRLIIEEIDGIKALGQMLGALRGV